RHCEALGVAEGWRCLEVGAGGGAVVEWLAERVGPRGRVVATDLDTRFLDALDATNVEVHSHDVLAEAPFEPGFDLVHARLGLEEIGAEGRIRFLRVDAPGIDFFRLSLEALRGPLVAQGRLTEASVEEALALFERDDLALRTPALIAAWGRAPAAE